MILAYSGGLLQAPCVAERRVVSGTSGVRELQTPPLHAGREHGVGRDIKSLREEQEQYNGYERVRRAGWRSFPSVMRIHSTG